MKHNTVNESSSASENTPNTFWWLYLSRFLGAWGDRQWFFGVGIFVFQLRPTDLMLNACLGLSQSLFRTVLGAAIGAWIDRTERLTAVKTFVAVQNISIAMACSVCAFFFFNQDADYDPIVFGTIVIALAVFAELAALGDRIVIERDWVVAIARTEDELARMNVVFQSIDLGCETVVTVFVGLLINFAGLAPTAVILTCWNMISACCEYYLLSLVYKEYPILSGPKTGGTTSYVRQMAGWHTILWMKIRTAWRGWKLYMMHPTRNAGLSLASLKMTVLSFGNVLWAYSLLQCVSEPVLCVFSGLGAVSGILGSLCFPCLRNRYGVEIAGQVGRVALQMALIACVAAMFFPGSPWILNHNKVQALGLSCPNVISVYVLLAGVVGARWGMFLTDIATMQIQQESVEEELRGSIGGVQESLDSCLDMMQYILVLLFPRARDFGYLVFASFGSMLLGAALYTSYAIPKVKFQRVERKTYDHEMTPLLHTVASRERAEFAG